MTKDGYQLGRDREEVLQSIPMPTTVNEMQSFLGVTVFFAKFVPYEFIAGGKARR